MKILILPKTKQDGFTYLELIIAITILVIVFGFFAALIRSTAISMAVSQEKMKMATVAQNMAQVYISQDPSDRDAARQAAIAEGSSQGYPSADLRYEPNSDGTVKVTITVSSIITDQTDRRYVEPYVLVFSTP